MERGGPEKAATAPQEKEERRERKKMSKGHKIKCSSYKVEAN